MTTVGRFCEKFVEAGWLVAVVIVATFLNPFSDQVFEPDKVALLRTLVALMATAWVIWYLDSGRADILREPVRIHPRQLVARMRRMLCTTPIAGPLLLLLLAYAVSTTTSASPRVSWWGSYERAQGTFTFLTYLGLFCLILATLRRADQLRRLLTVLIFTSFPVATYAVLQHYGMSLLQFSGAGNIEVRVISTLGNAIFLAAYLAMVMPLTLERALESAGRWHGQPTQTALATALYGGLFALQTTAIFFTQSRGPILGLLPELLVFILLATWLYRRPGWGLAGVLIGALIIGFLLILNIPSLPTDSLRSLPYLERFSRMMGAGATEVQARALAWDTTLKAVRADPLRLAVGYGPETMKVVFTRFMPARLWVLQGGGQYGTFDRAHNAVFDALFTQGVLGVAAYLLLYGTLFYQTLCWLGLARTPAQARGLMGLLAGGAGLGFVIPWVWRGDLALIGVGIPMGMLVGMILFLIGQSISAFRHESVPSPHPEPGTHSTEVANPPLSPKANSGEPTTRPVGSETHPLLLAALLSAIVGHFIETQTGIGITATRSYFWLYAALIILLGTGRIGEPEPVHHPAPSPAERSRPRRGRRGRRPERRSASGLLAPEWGPVAAMALVAAVLLGTLSYAFDHGFNVPGARRPAQALIMATWLFVGAVVLLERSRHNATPGPASRDVLIYAIISLGWLLPFVLYHRLNARTLDRLVASYTAFVVWLLLSVAGAAIALQWGNVSLRRQKKPNIGVVYPALIFLALFAVWSVDLIRVRADIHEKVGKTAMDAGLLNQAISNLQQAVALQPQQDQYYIYLGGAYVEQARLTSETATKEAWMDRARQALQQGWALAPHNSDHPRQLGLMYRIWADWAPDEAVRRQRLQRSLEYYLSAVELNPENPDLRLDLAAAYFALGMNDEALAQYQHAVDIGSPAHLGRAYAGLGDTYLVLGQLKEATEAYRKAMGVGRDRQAVLETRMRAAATHPDDIQLRTSLGLTYAAAGRKQEALKELNAALALASTETMRSQLEDLISMLEEK